jgi:hypothetical protein
MTFPQHFKPEIKTLLIVAFIAVAIILTVGGILLLRDDVRNQVSPAPSPTPSEQSAGDTSGWQTYRNDEFGFEVKYPDSYQVVKLSDKSIEGFNIDDSTGGFFFINTYDNSRGLSLSEWAKDDQTTRDLSTWEQISLNSMEGLKSPTLENIERGLDYDILISKDNKIYEISFRTSAPNVEGKLDVFKQILSTFRSVDAQSSLKPADSQTPATGACADPQSGDLAEIVLQRTPDNVPAPRCLLIRGEQRLQIKNATNETITVILGRVEMTLDPGETKTDNQTFDSYLARGVHGIWMSPPHVYEFPSPVTATAIWLQ